MNTLNAAQALHFQHQVVAIVASALRRNNVPDRAVQECVRLFDLMNQGIGIADEDVPPLRLVGPESES